MGKRGVSVIVLPGDVALRPAVDAPPPASVDLLRAPHIPPKITAEMTKGFTLYMVKAVMNGRADEVLDLARSNLWR